MQGHIELVSAYASTHVSVTHVMLHVCHSPHVMCLSPTSYFVILSMSYYVVLYSCRAVTNCLECLCRYVHDSSESGHDDMEFIATDGNNTAEFVLDIKVE